MFRILDYPDLDINTHKDIYAFIKKNHKKWLKDALGYFTYRGDWDELKKIIEKKLKDERFPESKAWLYLLILDAHPDKGKTRKIISKYTKSDHPMVREVANKLLQNAQG